MNDRTLAALFALAAAAGFALVPRTARADGAGESAGRRVTLAGDAWGGVAELSTVSIYEGVAAREGVPAYLLRAHAIIESGEDPDAYRDEGGGRASHGMMQILCPSPLPALEGNGWSGDYPVGGCESLRDPVWNVTLGARVLRWNLAQYGFPRGSAIYNRWASRNDPPGGPFGNQVYVDRLRRHLTAAQWAALVNRYGAGRRA